MTLSYSFSDYLSVLAQLGENCGDWRKGEIEIITDPALIQQVEVEKGVEIGIIDQDSYLIHIRDAVWFPPKSGEQNPSLGTYIRLVYANQLKGNLGLSFIAVTEAGEIVLNKVFRHSVRQFTIETGGTIAREGESREETLRRCIECELGRDVVKSQLLTESYIPERGLVSGCVPIYYVRVGQQKHQPSDPTVHGHLLLNKEQFFSALKAGKFESEEVTYLFNDGYTNTAVMLAILNGLL